MKFLASGLVEFPDPIAGEESAKGFVIPGTDFVFTNHRKPLFPEGFTKGDLGQYYLSVAPLLLPHLYGRPLSMSRYPDGVLGSTFYEKRIPSHAPGWVGSALVPSDSAGGVIKHVVADSAATLLWLSAMACIEMHPFHATIEHLDRPDYAIFDLDPAQGSKWDQVTTGALGVRSILDSLSLRSYPKLSGSKGLHVYVPLEPVHEYARIRRFVDAVGRLVVSAAPEDLTMEPIIKHRTGKVFIDVNRNAASQTVASVYSVRPRPGAPVSAPLHWDEVGEMANGDVTIVNLWDRVDRGGDLFAPVVQGGQRLDSAESTLGLP